MYLEWGGGGEVGGVPLQIKRLNNDAFINASKAFDRVNILLLFRKLRKRNFCPLFLRYLVNSYCNQMMMVRWNGSLSDKFDVTNGVKQSEVLSPLLFSVYMNDLLCQLRDQNIGCHMNSHFVGAVIIYYMLMT